ALARGTLRTVAATTWAEYKKHIEKDPALTRRFQVVQVDEPSEHKAILMMRGVASTMENSRRRIEALETELAIIRRESAIGVATAERQRNAETLLAEERERLAALEQRWAEEKRLVDELLETRARLRAAAGVHRFGG
ncbi:type VI secretion system ATPase TssH, partial [Pseudomonas aeruginosa]